jgi:hypothetical protein
MEIIPRHDRCSLKRGEFQMTTKCSRNRSIYAAAAFLAAFGVSGSSVWAQKPEVQRLFQAGSYEQAVEAAQNGDPPRPT